MAIHWAIQAVGQPAAEPVSLADAKLYCKVDAALTADDAEFIRCIRAARVHAETVTSRALVAQQFVQTLDRFPFPSNYDRALYSQDQFIPIGPTNAPFYEQFAVRLQRGPVVSVDALQYVDQTGVLTTLAADQYQLDAMSQAPRLLPAFGIAWPIARYQANAIQVTFTAGSMFPVAVDTTANTITASVAGGGALFVAGRGVRLYASGITSTVSMPTGLTAGQTYFPVSVSVDGTSCQLAATTGGAAIDVTAAAGAGSVILVDNLPETIRAAILLHVAMLYENRTPGAVEVATGLEPVDALLTEEKLHFSDQN